MTIAAANEKSNRIKVPGQMHLSIADLTYYVIEARIRAMTEWLRRGDEAFIESNLMCFLLVSAVMDGWGRR